MRPAAIHLRIGRLTVDGAAGADAAIDPAAVADAVRAQLAQRWGAGVGVAGQPAAASAAVATVAASGVRPAWAPAVADAVAQRWSPAQGGGRG